jgi:hypothetical protein
MKVAGIVLLCIGGLLILGSINAAFTQYDLGNSHDMSKFLGGAGFALLIAAVGAVMLIRSLKHKRNTQPPSQK